MVIVTTAVYWGLNSPLHPTRGLMVPLNLPAPGRRQSVYIDLPSSHGPVFLVHSRFPLVSAAHPPSPQNGASKDRAPLLPKLRGHFAEFLNHDSLVRLGILCPTTCVGLGYGRLAPSRRGFSRHPRITLISPTKRGVTITPHPHLSRRQSLRIYLEDGLRA